MAYTYKTFDWNQKPDHRVPTQVHSDKAFSVFYLSPWAMSCCGLGDMWNITGFESCLRAEGFEATVSAVVKAMIGNNAWVCWNLVFTVPDIRERMWSKEMKDFMEKMGAVKMGESFMNEAHGPNHLQMYRINFKNAVGKWIDKDGTILKKEEPKKEVHNVVKAVPARQVNRDNKGRFAKRPEQQLELGVEV